MSIGLRALARTSILVMMRRIEHGGVNVDTTNIGGAVDGLAVVWHQEIKASARIFNIGFGAWRNRPEARQPKQA